jgi:hypothetical protein
MKPRTPMEIMADIMPMRPKIILRALRAMTSEMMPKAGRMMM